MLTVTATDTVTALTDDTVTALTDDSDASVGRPSWLPLLVRLFGGGTSGLYL